MDNVPKGKMQVSRELAIAVAAEVRATLARQNMLIRDLSKKSGISPGYLGKRLRNEAPLNLNDLQAICDVFDKDVQTFLAAALAAGDGSKASK